MLIEKRTDRLLPDAWGGHMDAGDWDRNSRHPAAMWLLVDLYDLFPVRSATSSLRCRRGGEQRNSRRARRGALELALYRRLQTPDGGVGGGIESTSHRGPARPVGRNR